LEKRISNNKLDEAKKFHDKKNLEKFGWMPFDIDLVMLYNMLLAKYHINKGEVEEARGISEEAEANIKIKETNYPFIDFIPHGLN